MKRILSSSLAIAALVALIGCGGAKQASDAGQGKTEEKKPVTLTLLFYSPELAEQYTAMAKAYNEETGNTLDITVLQADFVTVLRAKLNSGDIPDVFMSSANADNYTYKDYYYDLTDQPFIKKIEPSALAGVTVNGRVTGYPFLVQSFSYIYNKKIFADAGITTLPRTIAEYEAVCQKLQAKGIQPFATGFKEWWVLPQTAWQVLAPVNEIYGAGDYQAVVDKLNSGELSFSKMPEMKNVFDMLDLIKKYGGPKPMESDFNDQCSAFATGKVAMIHQGNWAEDTIRKTNPDIDMGYLLGPVGDDPAKAGFMYFSNQTIRIAKDGKHRQAALDWLDWLTTSDFGKKWIPEQIKQISPIIGAVAPEAQLSAETLKLIESKAPAFPIYYQMFPTGTEQGLGTVLQGYCAGITDRARTLADLDSTYQKVAKAAEE